MSPPCPPRAPPAPRVRASHPRVGLAKSGPSRWPTTQLPAWSFGFPRLDQRLPSSVRNNSNLRQLLAVQDRRSRVSSQAVPVVAASRPTTLPLLVWNASSQVVPPSFVSLTRVPPAKSDTASQPRLAEAKRTASTPRTSVVHVLPPSVVRRSSVGQGLAQGGAAPVRTQA